jgi:hypothetical protein
MHVQWLNLRRKHWIFLYFLGFICLIFFAFISFLKWRGMEIIVATKTDVYQQVFVPYLGVDDTDFSRQFVVFTIDEQLHFSSLVKDGRQPSPGYVTNCSEPICEGPLAPIYCSGPLISSAWYFGLQHQCPGTKLLYEPDKIIANFRRILRGQIIKKGDFMQFCEENFANIDYLKPANLSDWQPNPKNFDYINDPKWR